MVTRKIKGPYEKPGKGFNRSVIFTLSWMGLGLLLDFIAHAQEIVENFFSLWHLILYSGVLAATYAMLPLMMRNIRRGYGLWLSLPEGYRSNIFFAPMVISAGLEDMGWHGVFGVEKKVDVQFSPSHIQLALGIAGMFLSPFRALWHKVDVMKEKLTWKNSGSAILGLALGVNIIRLLVMYLSPFKDVLPASNFFVLADKGLVPTSFQPYGIQLAAATLMAEVAFTTLVFYIVNMKMSLPFWSWTLTYSMSPILLAAGFGHIELVPSALAVGITADILAKRVNLKTCSDRSFRSVATILGGILGITYFLMLGLNGGTVLPIHVWPGLIVMLPLTGLAATYLPGRLPFVRQDAIPAWEDGYNSEKID